MTTPPRLGKVTATFSPRVAAFAIQVASCPPRWETARRGREAIRRRQPNVGGEPCDDITVEQAQASLDEVLPGAGRARLRLSAVDGATRAHGRRTRTTRASADGDVPATIGEEPGSCRRRRWNACGGTYSVPPELAAPTSPCPSGLGEPRRCRRQQRDRDRPPRARTRRLHWVMVQRPRPRDRPRATRLGRPRQFLPTAPPQRNHPTGPAALAATEQPPRPPAPHLRRRQ